MRRLMCLFCLCLIPLGAAWAEEASEYEGVPVILDSGSLMLQGKTLKLWALDTLAGDQHCWQGQRPWRCGEQATFALEHLVAGAKVRCVIKETTPDLRAQCFVKKGPKDIDLGAYLVKRGWALSTDSMDPSPYTAEENKAQDETRGVWTSRFQTAEDWKNGIQTYFNDTDNEDESE